MRRSVLVFCFADATARLGPRQPGAKLSDEVREFVKIDAAIVVLNHVRVIDGNRSCAPRGSSYRDPGWKNRCDRRRSGRENTRSR